MERLSDALYELVFKASTQQDWRTAQKETRVCIAEVLSGISANELNEVDAVAKVKEFEKRFD